MTSMVFRPTSQPRQLSPRTCPPSRKYLGIGMVLSLSLYVFFASFWASRHWHWHWDSQLKNLPHDYDSYLLPPPSQRHQLDTLSHTLVVVRCKGNLSWISQVPDDWSIKIYEKCQSTPSTKYSILGATQAGAEECNGYLDYIVDHYNNLSSVTVFMHDDGLYPWSKWKGKAAHTPFYSFAQVVNATKEYLRPSQG